LFWIVSDRRPALPPLPAGIAGKTCWNVLPAVIAIEPLTVNAGVCASAAESIRRNVEAVNDRRLSIVLS
jgi:hypothetical protein